MEVKDYEKDFSATQQTKKKDAWIQGKNEDGRWSQGFIKKESKG